MTNVHVVQVKNINIVMGELENQKLIIFLCKWVNILALFSIRIF